MGTVERRFKWSNTDQDQSWGTDIRKLTSSTTSLVTGTIASFGNAAYTNRIITLDPYSTNAAVTDIRTTHGWAINESTSDGMQSVLNAVRVIPAGQWNFTAVVNVPAPAALGSISARVGFHVYRVGPGPSFTRTGLFAATTGDQTNTGLAAVDQFHSVTSGAQPAYTLAPGETIHVGIQIASTQVGTPVTNATVVNNQGFPTNDDTWVEVPSPGIRTKYSISFLSIMLGIASKLLKVGLPLNAVMKQIPVLNRKITAFRVFNSVMLGVPSLTRRITAFRRLDAVLKGFPSPRIVLKVGKKINARMAGVASPIRKKMFRLISVRMDGVPTVSKLVKKLFSVVMKGIPVRTQVLRIARTLTATMKGRGKGLVTMAFESLPDGVINVTKKIIHIFDD